LAKVSGTEVEKKRTVVNRSGKAERNMTMRHITMFLFLVLMLVDSVAAGQLYGTIYTGGAPAMNMTIAVEGTNIRTQTDRNGRYSIELPPGDHTLLIRGQRINVTVSTEAMQKDIRF
jgi:Carboxypeptidase regulatory-like domain